MRPPAALGAAVILAAAALPASAQGVTGARYEDPTTRYTHGVLGDAIEHGTLALDLTDGRRVRIVLPETRVFEDTEPRVVDLDGDGLAEVIAVETDLALGARLAIYGPRGLIAATDFIGQTNRWLAPAGAADLDGDGFTEIAYVDRPHLARTLMVWRFRDGRLEQVATLDGVTNHRIGERDIAGGIRDCGDGPEVIVADAGWTTIEAVRLAGATLTARTLGPHEGRASFARAMACRD